MGKYSPQPIILQNPQNFGFGVLRFAPSFGVRFTSDRTSRHFLCNALFVQKSLCGSLGVLKDQSQVTIHRLQKINAEVKKSKEKKKLKIQARKSSPPAERPDSDRGCPG